MYLKPGYAGGRYVSPLEAAYDLVRGARLPAEGWRPQAETAAAFAREEAVVRWLVDSFLPANAGSRFVSVAELRGMTQTSVGTTVPAATLAAAARDLLDRWTRLGANPPEYAQAGSEYFSLADMFQMLATALARFDSSGAIPESVRLSPVYGPLEMTEEAGPREGSFTIAALASVAADLAPRLNDREWRPVPVNVVPSWVTVEAVRMNAAQFLRLMAEAYVQPTSDARLALRNSYMFSAIAEAFPKSRRRAEVGAVWTLKPATLAGRR
jgi:hypothetical protein